MNICMQVFVWTHIFISPGKILRGRISGSYGKFKASQVVLMVKNPPANAGDARDEGFDPWVRKILWRRKWQHTPVFLLGESHGQGSQAGYSPWGHKQSDTIEHAPTHPFCWEEYSGLAVFSFITLNISFSLLDSKASVEKSTDSIMMVPLYVRGCFLPATF